MDNENKASTASADIVHIHDDTRSERQSQCTVKLKTVLQLCSTILIPIILAVSTTVLSIQQQNIALANREKDIALEDKRRTQDALLADKQREKDREIANQTRMQDQLLEEQRREQDRLHAKATLEQEAAMEEHRLQQQALIADNIQKDLTLANYVHEMSDLFLRYNFSFTHELLLSVIRPKTLMALRQLDTTRKAYLISFLHDSSLLFRNDLVDNKNGSEPINLVGAALDHIDLSVKIPSTDRRAWLGSISLAGASLTNSSFVNRYLVKADFSDVSADNVDFAGADIVYARFYRASLRQANFDLTAMLYNDFTKADLTGAKYIDDNALDKAVSLVGAILPNGTKARGENLLRNSGGEMAVDSECDDGDLPEYWKTGLGQVTTVRARTNDRSNRCYFVGTGSGDISSIYQVVSLDHARYWTEQGRGEFYIGAFLSPNSYINVTQVIVPHTRIAGKKKNRRIQKDLYFKNIYFCKDRPMYEGSI
jgi:uncharacterized protein YjbI with pentapeptide repeats